MTGRDSYAIATVRIGGAKADGTPWAYTTAAVCDSCGAWATEIWTSSRATTTDPKDISNIRVSRETTVVAYACPDHSEQVMNSVCNEYGHAFNAYEPDDLAIMVSEASNAREQARMDCQEAPDL